MRLRAKEQMFKGWAYSIIFFCLYWASSRLFAQSIEAIPAWASAQQSEQGWDIPLMNHCLSAGVSVVRSDVTAQNFGLMYSGLYSYRTSSRFAIEALVTILHHKRAFTNTFISQYAAGQNIPLNFREEITLGHSFSGNINAVFAPFANTSSSSGLQLGLGLSFRSAGVIISSNEILNFIDPKKQKFQFLYSFQTALGGNGFLEYIIPLSTTIDLGVRAQCQVFLPPLSVVGDSIPLNTVLDLPIVQEKVRQPALGSLGIGLFLRMNF